MTALAPAPAVRTFQPTQRIIGREVRGDRAAVELELGGLVDDARALRALPEIIDLECGHVADVPTGEALITLRCAACKPVEVLRG